MPQPSFLPPSRPDVALPAAPASVPASGGSSDAGSSFPAVLAAHGTVHGSPAQASGSESAAGGGTQPAPCASDPGAERPAAKEGKAVKRASSVTDGKTAVKGAGDGKNLPHSMPPDSTLAVAVPRHTPGQSPQAAHGPSARQGVPSGTVAAAGISPSVGLPAVQTGQKAAAAATVRLPASLSASMVGSGALATRTAGNSASGPVRPSVTTTGVLPTDTAHDAVASQGASISKELEAKAISANPVPAPAHPATQPASTNDLFQPVLSAVAAGPPVATAAPGNPAAALQINPPITQAGWDQALGSSMVWMVNGRIQSAQLNINPPHLGPIEVHIAIRNDQTSVAFVSTHSEVRDALQSAIPGLREAFASNGLNLANVDISQHSFSQNSRQGDSRSSHRAVAALSEDDIVAKPTAMHVGLIDFYA